MDITQSQASLAGLFEKPPFIYAIVGAVSFAFSQGAYMLLVIIPMVLRAGPDAPDVYLCDSAAILLTIKKLS